MIKLSSKWNHAIKAVMFLIKNEEWLINISQIAKEENISESLLRRIIADLDRANIVTTIKWRNWWIYIERDIKTISLYDILNAVWEDLWIKECSSWEKCYDSVSCNVFPVYNELQKSFNAILKIYTLDKIKKRVL